MFIIIRYVIKHLSTLTITVGADPLVRPEHIHVCGLPDGFIRISPALLITNPQELYRGYRRISVSFLPNFGEDFSELR